MPIMPFCDLIISVFPVAWIFGRSGCSVVHDHPGAFAAKDALFAVAYGKGPITTFGPIEFIHGSRPQYDLGTLELFFTIILSFLLALTWRKRLACGTYLAVFTLAYSPVRFAMDFLRVRDVEQADPRYGGLTPALWECIALFLFGVVMSIITVRMKKRGDDPTELVLAPDPAPEAAAAAAGS